MNRSKAPRFRPGETVEVRSQDEIRATLDADGKLDGLPFMSEMVPCCGRRLRIYRRAEKVFLDRRGYVARLRQTVLLDGVRCNGRAHGGCQMGCLMFWKEAWLKPVEPGMQPEAAVPAERPAPGALEPPTADGQRFCCQATALVDATARLRWWDVRQYIRDLSSGQVPPRQFAHMLLLLAYNKLRGLCGLEAWRSVNGRQEKTTAETLNLQPGELVRVKTRPEIEATLDKLGRNRGLGFATDQLRYCGGTYRVAGRVEKMIVEWSGELRQLRNTVVLEGVTCNGVAFRCCPRDCFHLWREAWLTRLS